MVEGAEGDGERTLWGGLRGGPREGGDPVMADGPCWGQFPWGGSALWVEQSLP